MIQDVACGGGGGGGVSADDKGICAKRASVEVTKSIVN